MEKWVRSVHFNQTLSSTNGLLNNDSNDTSFIDGELQFYNTLINLKNNKIIKIY